MTARLQEFYKEQVVPKLIEQFGFKSIMEVPRITKITLNMGLGEAINDKKVIELAVGDLTKIAGQKPVVTKARRPSPASRSARATHRCDGDPARRAHVRIPRSFRHRGAAACA